MLAQRITQLSLVSMPLATVSATNIERYKASTHDWQDESRDPTPMVQKRHSNLIQCTPISVQRVQHLQCRDLKHCAVFRRTKSFIVFATLDFAKSSQKIVGGN